MKCEHRLTVMKHEHTKKVDSMGVSNAEYIPMGKNPARKSDDKFWTVALIFAVIGLLLLVGMF